MFPSEDPSPHPRDEKRPGRRARGVCGLSVFSRERRAPWGTRRKTRGGSARRGCCHGTVGAATLVRQPSHDERWQTLQWCRRAGLAAAWPGRHDDGVKLKLDLHDIYNRGEDIERALLAIIDEAAAKKAPLVEIIPGKGSGQLKKRVLRFLDRKEIKARYHRVEKDSDNFGRVFVHFRWK